MSKESNGPNEVLSQDEIANLLDKVNNGDFEEGEYCLPEIKIYDFKRPDKFSRDQIRTLAMIHETFARICTTGLSAHLRTMAHIHVASVDQLTYEEFIRSIPCPTTIGVLDLPPLKGSAVIEIDPSITFTMIDILFGGSGKGNGRINRELTEIEGVVMEGLISQLLPNLQASWSNVINFKPQLGRIEVNPAFAQIVPPNDMVVLVTLEAMIGDATGMINICFPYITIESVIPLLSGQYWFSSIRKGRYDTATVTHKIGDLKVDGKLFIKGESLSLHQLSQVKKGSLIKLPDFENGEVFLESGKKVVAKMTQPSVPLRKKYIFDLSEAEKKNDWQIPEKTRTGDQTGAQLKKLLDESFKTLNSAMQHSIHDLEDRMQKMSSQQDDIMDQLSFTYPHNEESSESTFVRQYRPFTFIAHADFNLVVSLLQGEHPQTIALVLSYLDGIITSQILTRFDEKLQYEVAQRIAVIDRTMPEVLVAIEKVLERKVHTFDRADHLRAGGIESLADVLNLVDRKTEMSILTKMEKDNPELAEEIKKRMFVFEDIILLDEDTIKTVMGFCEFDDIVLSLKVVNDEVKQKILMVFDPDEKTRLEKVLEETSHVRLKIIEDAQLRIINVIRKLEEEGRIYIARSDEPIVE